MTQANSTKDDDKILGHYVGVGSMLANMFPGLLEIAVHDYRTPEHSIIAIFNHEISGREVGTPLSEMGHLRLSDESVPDLIENYSNQSPLGHKLKSSSLAIRNDCGDLIGAFCCNLDVSAFTLIDGVLGQLLANSDNVHQPGSEKFYTQTPRDEIRNVIERHRKQHPNETSCLTKSDKMDVVKELSQSGFFEKHGTVTLVAQELNLSRPSVYNYMEQ